MGAMRDPESDTVVDITRLLRDERDGRGGRGENQSPASSSRDAPKTDGIRAKVRSFAKKLLERKENEIADQIVGDHLLIDGINYEDDLLDQKRAENLYKSLRGALEYYRQQPQNLAVYKRIHRETGFFSLLALYVELTANAANKPGFQYLTPEQIQFFKQVHAKIPALMEITKHMEYLHHVSLAKQKAIQRQSAADLRTRVTGRTGPVPAEQSMPDPFIDVLLDVLHKLQKEEKKPLSQHANIAGAIGRLTEAVRQHSVGLNIVQRAIEIACPDFAFENPASIAMLLIRGVENELQP